MDDDSDVTHRHPHQLPHNNVTGSATNTEAPTEEDTVHQRASGRDRSTGSYSTVVGGESTTRSSSGDNVQSTPQPVGYDGATAPNNNNNRARDALQRELRRRAEQIAAREAQEELRRAEEPSHQHREKDSNRVSNREIHQRPHNVITRAPSIRRAIILDSQWMYGLFPGSCSLRALFCVRCDIINHWEIIRELELAETYNKSGNQRLHHPIPDNATLDTTVYYGGMLDGVLCERCCSVVLAGRPRRMLAVMLLCDILSAGLPCGPFYHGCGTAIFGWWGRWMVRRKYRLRGYGWSDFLVALCCPGCMVEQERSEIAFNGQLFAAANNDVEMR